MMPPINSNYSNDSHLPLPISPPSVSATSPGGLSPLIVSASARQATNTLVITIQPYETKVLNEISTLATHAGDVRYFTPLRTFERCLITYTTSAEAARLKALLPRGTQVLGSRIGTFFGTHTPLMPPSPTSSAHSSTVENSEIESLGKPSIENDSENDALKTMKMNKPIDKLYLQLPQSERQWLVSPPGSPPAGWVQEREGPPNDTPIAADLIAALRKLDDSGYRMAIEIPSEGSSDNDDDDDDDDFDVDADDVSDDEDDKNSNMDIDDEDEANISDVEMAGNVNAISLSPPLSASTTTTSMSLNATPQLGNVVLCDDGFPRRGVKRSMTDSSVQSTTSSTDSSSGQPQLKQQHHHQHAEKPRRTHTVSGATMRRPRILIEDWDQLHVSSPMSPPFLLSPVSLASSSASPPTLVIPPGPNGGIGSSSGSSNISSIPKTALPPPPPPPMGFH
ncbi:hypothetical protein GQ42DRAFT_165614 [Ramicandelaber brevisporus]|nr:hypothetical protein GQ42DRAFT_165626 [Ramicandelaber brevisporus]KAI8866279.1 hypothetical protein GQ42DRAFT_165614 [Ramicandelaber brevisporus]